MKIQKILLILAATLFIGQSNLFANEASEFAVAHKSMVKEIHQLVRRAPVDLITEDVAENKVVILIRLSDQGEVSSYEVEGQNEDLNHWVEMQLKKNSLHANPVLAGIKYRVPVSYIVNPK